MDIEPPSLPSLPPSSAALYEEPASSPSRGQARRGSGMPRAGGPTQTRARTLSHTRASARSELGHVQALPKVVRLGVGDRALTRGRACRAAGSRDGHRAGFVSILAATRLGGRMTLQGCGRQRWAPSARPDYALRRRRRGHRVVAAAPRSEHGRRPATVPSDGAVCLPSSLAAAAESTRGRQRSPSCRFFSQWLDRNPSGQARRRGM